MSSKVSCNLMVDDSEESSFLFAVESTGQLDRDITVQNRMGNSYIAFALSIEEALEAAKQIQTQYMDYTQSVVEKQREESKKLKEQVSKLSPDDEAGDAKGTADTPSDVKVSDGRETDPEGTEDESE